MKVKELIEKLQELDQDAVVKYWSDDCHGGMYQEVESADLCQVTTDSEGKPVSDVIIE